MIRTVVLSGGNVAGFYLLGALRSAKRMGYLRNALRYRGTSAGALVALVFLLTQQHTDAALDRLIAEIVDCVQSHQWRCNLRRSCYPTDPRPRRGEEEDPEESHGIFALRGLVVRICRDVLRLPKALTFAELARLTNGCHLTVTAYCVADMQTRVFSTDTDPDVLVEDAIAMSCSIPFLFRPVRAAHDCKLYVDGGIEQYVPFPPAPPPGAEEGGEEEEGAREGTLCLVCDLKLGNMTGLAAYASKVLFSGLKRSVDETSAWVADRPRTRWMLVVSDDESVPLMLSSVTKDTVRRALASGERQMCEWLGATPLTSSVDA